MKSRLNSKTSGDNLKGFRRIVLAILADTIPPRRLSKEINAIFEGILRKLFR